MSKRASIKLKISRPSGRVSEITTPDLSSEGLTIADAFADYLTTGDLGPLHNVTVTAIADRDGTRTR